MLLGFQTFDNRLVGKVENIRWIVVKSQPIQRTPLLKSLLAEKFPQIRFCFMRFTLPSLEKEKRSKSERPHGVVAELKKFPKNGIFLFDALCRQFKHSNLVFILSPNSYSILKEKRRSKLMEQTMIISEMKSLDYLAQLPRVIEEIGLKQQLLAENKKLEKLVRERVLGFQSSQENPPLNENFRVSRYLQTSSSEDSSHGLKIKLNKWTRLKKEIGDMGQNELISSMTRIITGVVRSSDRVLRTKEDEFIVFLSDVDRHQITKCIDRLRQALKDFSISVNQKHFPLPFTINTLHDIPYNS